MIVKWKVYDGKFGETLHETDVPDESLAMCESEDERDEVIREYVQMDFKDNVQYFIIGSE